MIEWFIFDVYTTCNADVSADLVNG